jgi:DNA-binding winged helix-turn-helix (wHTH) protein
VLKIFGEFELDDHRRLLKASGRPVRLTGQALDLLCLLLERPGEAITREEIHRRLWPDTHVELEHSLDVTVSRLRAVLDDRNATPRYIQTLPRKGYRFIEPVIVQPEALAATQARRWPRRVATIATAAILAAILAILFVRTRYEKFVPSRHAQPSPAARAR